MNESKVMSLNIDTRCFKQKNERERERKGVEVEKKERGDGVYDKRSDI